MRASGPLGRSVATRRAALLLCLLIDFQNQGAGPDAPESGPREYTTKVWQTEDGLPQMTPRAITQTRDGYFWVGTFNGLARFDGIQFRSFTVNTTPELESDQINVLYEDRGGDLWIGTGEGGLVRYRDGVFTRFPAASRVSVNAICEDVKGRLWLATSDGLYTISENRLEPRHREKFDGLPVTKIVPGAENDIWIGIQTNLYRMRDGAIDEHHMTFDDQIHEMGLDQQGRLWVTFAAAGLGFVERDATTFYLERHRFKANVVHRAKSGAFWIGTWEGPLLQLQPGVTNQFARVYKPGNFPISAIFEDREGNLWLGVESAGLWRLREKLVTTLGKEHGLLTAMISSMCQDREGRIWVGTFGRGLHLWDGQRFESVRRDAQNLTTLLEDRGGNLWYGKFAGGLGRRDQEGNFDFPGGFGVRCRVLFEDREGGLWMGSLDKGVECLKDGRVTPYTVNEGMSSDHIRAIGEDGANNIWIGTSKGLNRVCDGRIQKYFREDGLGGNEVRTLFLDSEKTLWIGSTGGGLTRWRDGVLKSIGVREGLINDWIEQILEDDQGNLWLGSNGGIMRVSLRQLNECASGLSRSVDCTVFGTAAGLLLPSCGTGFQRSCLKTADGKLWFGTDAGIVVVDPKNIKARTDAPAVYIEEIHTEGEVFSTEQGSNQPKRLRAGTQRLEFHYTALDFSAPTMVRFRYKLEGLDTDWVNAGVMRDAVYTRVPPGEYRFQVKAANNHGVWNETGASLAVLIEPFFWQTRAFQISATAGGLMAGGLLIWMLLTRKHRREMEALEKRHALERERARIARDMHDGVGASLVKISLLGELATRRIAEPDHAEAQVRKMTAAARQVVRDMDEIVWAVDPKNDTLENFAGYLCQFTTEHFQDTQVECRLEVPPELPAHSLSAATRHNLLLAIREALNNVLKHARATKARVRLRLINSTLVIEIEDNGQGFATTRQHQGNGLQNMRQRLAQIGGAAKFCDGTEQGTRIVFDIPIM